MAFGYSQTIVGYSLTALAGLIVTRLIWELFFSPLRKYPGPFIARFTNLWRARAVYIGEVPQRHRQWHEQYGSAVRVGPNAVMLNDPELIKTIYTGKHAWLKTDFYRPNDAVGPDGTRHWNLFNAQDEAWYDRNKRPVGGLYGLSKVLEMEHLVDETIGEFVEKLEETFLKDTDVSGSIKMDEWLAFFSWDSNMNLTYGRHYGFIEQAADVDNMIKTSKAGLKYFGVLCQIPWLDKWLDKSPVWRIGPRPLMGALVFSQKVTAEYRQQLAKIPHGGPSPSHSHLLERYVKAKSTHPAIVDDAQVINYTLLSIGGGGDTTAATLRAIVYHLARTPSSYAKLSDELSKAQLSTPVSWKDATALPYLDAVIRESMRITPGIPAMLERYVPKGGFQLPDGRFLPEDTKAGLNPGVTNRNTGVFGDMTDSFVPERWLQGENESAQAFDARLRKMSDIFDFTFGAGKRICIGRNMAKLEVYKLIATLYTLYDIKLVDPSREWKHEGFFFVYQSDMPMVLSRKK